MLANRPSESTGRPQRLAARDCLGAISDDGATWQPATDQSVFAGIVVRTAVHGPRGFVALGWNDASQTNAIRPVTEWFSADGLSWARVSGVPIRGTYAYVFATASGYLALRHSAPDRQRGPAVLVLARRAELAARHGYG